MDSFAQSVATLVQQRDTAFLERIAADYSLNLEELRAKYVEAASTVKVPRKYKPRKPKEVVVRNLDAQEGEPAAAATSSATVAKPAKADKPKCQGITGKKEPCSFSALKGECYCKRHLEAAQAAASGEGPAPKAKKAKKEAAPAPAPVAEAPEAVVEEEEFEVAPESRLAALLAQMDDSEEEQEEGEFTVEFSEDEE